MGLPLFDEFHHILYGHFKDAHIQGIADKLAFSFPIDEIGSFENIEMVGESGLGYLYNFQDFRRSLIAVPQQVEDLPPRRVGKRFEKMI